MPDRPVVDRIARGLFAFSVGPDLLFSLLAIVAIVELAYRVTVETLVAFTKIFKVLTF